MYTSIQFESSVDRKSRLT